MITQKCCNSNATPSTITNVIAATNIVIDITTNPGSAPDWVCIKQVESIFKLR